MFFGTQCIHDTLRAQLGVKCPLSSTLLCDVHVTFLYW